MFDAPVLLRRSAVNLLSLVCKVRVLQLLRARCLGEGILDAASNDAALKQDMDRLEWYTLGLGYAEDGVDAHDDTARSKEQEGTVSDVCEHDLGDVSIHISK